jgi:hypothetical protein
MNGRLKTVVLGLLVVSMTAFAGLGTSLAAQPSKSSTVKLTVSVGKVKGKAGGTVSYGSKTCKSTCNWSVPKGKTVKLSEKASGKAKFQHWVVAGAMKGSSPTLSVVVSKAETVKAVYK